MSRENWLERLLERLFIKPLLEGKTGRLTKQIYQKYEAEASKAPKIAFVGLSGVGKSSTINALFGASLAISHTRKGTTSPTEILAKGKNVSTEKGEIVIFDMPGIGENFETDENYKTMYQQIISRCDVAVWIIDAATRTIGYDQIFIHDVIQNANKDLTSRLVIGVNKVDIIHPNNWSFKANLPSVEQEQYINERLLFVSERLTKVVPSLTRDRIIGYSAARRYHLGDLFHAMLKACDKERAWVLESRRDIADFWELVDPQYRDEVWKRNKDSE